MTEVAEDRLSDEKLAQLAEMREAAEEDTGADDTSDEVEDDTTAGEPEAKAPRPEPASDQAMEKIGKQLDAEATRHGKRVAEIMGQEMETLAPCPLCVTPGFVLGLAPPDFDPDQRAAVMAAMGEGGDGTYREHPDLITCETCNGLGHLLTGARNEANYVVSCPECISKGYINVKEKAAQDQAIRDATAYVQQPAGVATAMAVQAAGVNGDPGVQPQPWYDYATQQWRL